MSTTDWMIFAAIAILLAAYGRWMYLAGYYNHMRERCNYVLYYQTKAPWVERK